MPAVGVEAPEHLNNTGCVIRNTSGKGRGVFGIEFSHDLAENPLLKRTPDVPHVPANRTIPAQTVIEISPVLLFGKDEYALHGKYTTLDHYTFVWKNGQYALALGLGEIYPVSCWIDAYPALRPWLLFDLTSTLNVVGSLFNHSPTPNLNYTRDYNTGSIKYTTSREVQAGEELCIFYGTKLWFEEAVNTEDDVLQNDRPLFEKIGQLFFVYIIVTHKLGFICRRWRSYAPLSTPRVRAKGIGHDTVPTRERGMKWGTEKVTYFSEEGYHFATRRILRVKKTKAGEIRSQEW